MLKASFRKYMLNFKLPAGTSRGVLRAKETFFLKIEKEGEIGIGECSVFRGLSFDDRPDYEQKLTWLCENINLGESELIDVFKLYPSIQFGIEMAFIDLKSKESMILFPSKFTKGLGSISINGLIWMGDLEFMMEQIAYKLEDSFTCIKIKIGAINFEQEVSLIKRIRKQFSSKEIEIRVDANGGFSAEEALEKLKILSDLEIHSIEQPIKQGQIEEIAELCDSTPLDIALDEELIGIVDIEEKKKLISTIKPQYIILKPSLVGGIRGSIEWIDIASRNNSSWWITSALESNIGLNAIAQWTYTLASSLPQGLGTGSLFTNNIESPLTVSSGKLEYSPELKWNLPVF
ncbi:MAG: o-succinylbenzoate synthase, partial [Flavobacteriales bacterium]|nr:o-succinylbenzoate synthase [Flavobacteriales bacterium]